MSSADGSASPPLRCQLVKRFHAVPASGERYGLAEGPFWDGERERVLWVDVNAGTVHTGTLAGRRVTHESSLQLPETVGAVVASRRGELLVAGARRLYIVSPDGAVSLGPSIVPERTASRLNDGCCDAAGRFLVGSLALDGRAFVEVLVRVDVDGKVLVLDDDIGMSNGLAFSPRGDRLYSVDTLPGVVWVRDYDADTGEVGRREEFLRLGGDKPDGLCVDDQGNLWIAMWGAGAVRCYSSTAEPTAVIEVAAPNTTSVAFVGASLDTLLITTASEQLSEAQRSRYPDSGRLFTARGRGQRTAGCAVARQRRRRRRSSHQKEGERPMKAFVVTAPHRGAVHDVPTPVAADGQVVVDISRAGVCGTDVEFWTGEMVYLHQGHARYPIRLGHEWSGVVSSVGPGVDAAWLRRRVTGDTMLGCGHCDRCRSGRHNVCETRFEVGIRGGFPGALAEQLVVPASALRALPDSVDDVAGAMVEPGGNALRSVRAAALAAGDRALVLGTGTMGLLAAEFARADGVEVHLMGRSAHGLEFAATLGFAGVWRVNDLPRLRWDAVIDASNAAELPAMAVDLVEPGKRVVYLGVSGSPSLVDTRTLVLKDVTAVGILAASQGLAGTIERYAAGSVDPRPLVAATVGLDRVGDVLGGWRPDSAMAGPKLQIDPRMPTDSQRKSATG